MSSRNREITEQLEKDIAALKEKAQDELLNELTLRQKDKLNALTGDSFEPQVRDWQGASTDSLRKQAKIQRARNRHLVLRQH